MLETEIPTRPWRFGTLVLKMKLSYSRAHDVVIQRKNAVIGLLI